MAWITPTTDALLTEGKLMDAEFQRLGSVQLGEGLTRDDLLDSTKARMLLTLRGYIAVKHSGSLGADGTLPEELYDAFLSVWVVQFLNRLGSAGKSFLTDQRLAASADAVKLFERVAEGKFAISVPAEISDEQTVSASTGATLIPAKPRPL